MKPSRFISRCWPAALVALLGSLALTRSALAQTPVAHWSFDTGSGTAASDSSANGHTATLSGAASWTGPGKLGPSALSLTKTSSSYATATGPVVNTNASFTAAAWVKLTSSTGSNQTFLSIDGNSSSNFYLQYNAVAGRFAFERRLGDDTTSGFTVVTATATAAFGTWYHVAGVYDAAAHTIALYVNGTLQQSAAYPAVNSWQATGNTAIGRGKWNGINWDAVDGVIDEACFYATALTGTQISGLYNGVTLSGTVFEDVGYSGGVGRSLASSGGSGRSGARVEFYDALGNYVGALTTGTGGTYSATGSANLAYTVRVVSSTVTSSLGGTSLVPVQTYRTTATSGTAVAVTDRVGGEDPDKTDAGNASTTLAALTSGSLTPQSITSVTAATTTITGLDFGFNFNTIVNVNDTGQGSLRQLITNANAMSGTQTSVFMITDGSTHAGLRSGLSNQLTGGVAIITPATALPQITDTLTLDGTSQTANIGNTNSGTLGAGGTVGVDSLTLSTVNRPEIELVGTSSLTIGLNIAAASTVIQGLAIHGFGTTYANGDLAIAASSVTITQCVLGTTATSFSLPTNHTGGDTIYIASGSSGLITSNLLGFADNAGIRMENNAATNSWTITNNEIRGHAIFESARNGLTLRGTGHTVSGNLFSACKGVSIGLQTTGGSSLVQNNTVTGGGFGTAGTPETAGVLVASSGNTLDRNLIISNCGSGVLVYPAATGNKLTRNSISNNGAIGLDLQTSADAAHTGTAPYYTLNDDGDADTGGNGLLNFPVLATATLVGSNLEISGWAPTAATLEFFLSDGDTSKFGEGQTYLGSVAEGGGADTDATSSNYSGTVNGFAQGSGTAVRRFKYTFARPAGASNGVKLTATATDASNNTSEFSGQVTIASIYPSFTVVTSSQIYSDPLNATTHPKAIPGSLILISSVTTNSNAAPSDTDAFTVTGALPAGAELYVGDLAGLGSGPVSFTDGATSAALTYAFTSLASTTDDVEFSNDNGATWSYTPTPDSDSCDATVTHLRIKPQGAFAAAAGGNNPSCTVAYRVRVK